MQNNFGKGSTAVNMAAQLAFGHYKFMEANRGYTENAELQHYVTNPDYVLANNRHFIARSQQQAQPNGDATTEGQSLQILGYAYMYEATRDPRYLEAAEAYFESYVKNFYQEDVPDTARRWVCNWIINGKEPVLANWPVDFKVPTHSGFKGPEKFEWRDGKFQIPHGEPYWGEYLDKATFAFVGNLGWDSIAATVYGVKPDGSTDWDNKGLQLDVDWIINWECKKIDWDGNVLETGLDPELRGTVQLKNTRWNDLARLCWGNRQPVEHGGYLMGRNEAWHNRPLNVPVGKENFGNAADAEQWFLDCCYKLWELTGKERYWKAFKACEYTNFEYLTIDQEDRYFRQSNWTGDPFSDGISYWYSYPSTVEPVFTRDKAGYINIRANAASQQTLEQNAIWEHVGEASTITTTTGGLDDLGNPLKTTIIVSVAQGKDDKLPQEDWMLTLPETHQAPTPFTVAMASLTKEKNPYNGRPYITADIRAFVSWTGGSGPEKDWIRGDFETNVYDTRSATVMNGHIPSGGGFMIGAWLLPEKKFDLKSIVYRADQEATVQIYDPNGWRWICKMPKSQGWSTFFFSPNKFSLASYQPNYPETPPELWPTSLIWAPLPSFNIVQSDDKPLDFSWYCINDVPERFKGSGYTIRYSVTVKGDAPFTAYVGDCMARNVIGKRLFCTPGVIPFSNIYNPGQEAFDGWHGMPYPGYQYPFIFTHSEHERADEMLNNMVEFLWSSQRWFYEQYGTLGPGASQYIWNRWDNLKYGKPDTWQMTQWGGHAWDGYQSRAFFGACRAAWELKKWNKPVPPKLKEYIQNWVRFLIRFMKNYGTTPTLFTVDGKVPGVTDDYTGHMSALWMGGACFAAACWPGEIKEHDWFIHEVFRDIQDNFHVVDGKPHHIMNGSWSPGLRLNTGDGPENDGLHFGFWSGETLRGLGIYILYNSGRL